MECARGRDEPVVVGPTKNNNDTCHKNQKKTTVSFDNNNSDYYSLPTPTNPVAPVFVATLLSVGTVIQQFPDFVSYVLPYIADRTVFNALASSNKNIYKQSQKIIQHWPINYKIKKFLAAVRKISWLPFVVQVLLVSLV